MKNHRFISLVIALLLAFSLVGCGTLKSVGKLASSDVIEQYDYLITDYQNAQMETTNAHNCMSLAYMDINTQIGLANMAMQAEVARTAAYAQTMSDYFNTPSQEYDGKTPNEALTAANESIAAQNGAYVDANGNAIPSNQLDLAKLAAQNALPAQLATNFNIVAKVYTQAPLPPANFGPIENAQAVTSEKTNMIFACTKASNDAILTYNTDRQKASGVLTGEIATKLAEYLHVSELPQSLPYFEVAGPNQINPVPTFGTTN